LRWFWEYWMAKYSGQAIVVCVFWVFGEFSEWEVLFYGNGMVE
jgi:hypothetical protein